MSDIQNLVGTAHYAKKISDGNYGSEEAGFFVQFDYDANTPANEIASLAQDAMAQAKARTLDALGGTAGAAAPAPADVILGNFPGSVVEPASAPAPDNYNATTPAPQSAPATSPSSSGYASAPAAMQPIAQTTGAHPQTTAACAKCGQTGFWDNRADNAAKAAAGDPKASKRPAFKCKNKQCGNGVWEKN